MTIDSTERIVMPFQPLVAADALSAITGGSIHSIDDADWDSGETNNGKRTSMTFNYVHTNIGSYWNNSTGLFTVPVAGRYLVFFNNNYHQTSSWPNAYIMHNKVDKATCTQNVSSNADAYNPIVVCCIIEAAANDTIWPAYHDDYSAPIVSTSRGYHAFFIYLLG